MLDDCTHSVLQKRLNYAVTPRITPVEDILASVKKAVHSLPFEIKEARQETVKARLDGASFRAPAHATLHPLVHASWCKSHASLAACLLLFRRC
jgi:hypothetical protein